MELVYEWKPFPVKTFPTFTFQNSLTTSSGSPLPPFPLGVSLAQFSSSALRAQGHPFANGFALMQSILLRMPLLEKGTKIIQAIHPHSPLTMRSLMSCLGH